MLEINNDSMFTLSNNIFLQKIEELNKYWVFNIETGEHYSLNETSYWILEQITANISVKSMLRDFIDTYKVKKGQRIRTPSLTRWLMNNIRMSKNWHNLCQNYPGGIIFS